MVSMLSLWIDCIAQAAEHLAQGVFPLPSVFSCRNQIGAANARASSDTVLRCLFRIVP